MGNYQGERHYQRRKRSRKGKATVLRTELDEEGKASDEGVICTLTMTEYLFDGTSGSSRRLMMAARFAFDTGASFNIIRK